MGVRTRSNVPTASNQYGLSISTTAVSLTVPRAGMAGEIYVRTGSGSIVFKRDAGTPTATEGFQADPGDIIVLNSRAELDNFRAVRQGGTDGTVDVEYFTDISG